VKPLNGKGEVATKGKSNPREVKAAIRERRGEEKKHEKCPRTKNKGRSKFLKGPRRGERERTYRSRGTGGVSWWG